MHDDFRVDAGFSEQIDEHLIGTGILRAVKQHQRHLAQRMIIKRVRRRFGQALLINDGHQLNRGEGDEVKSLTALRALNKSQIDSPFV